MENLTEEQIKKINEAFNSVGGELSEEEIKEIELEGDTILEYQLEILQGYYEGIIVNKVLKTTEDYKKFEDWIFFNNN